MLPDRTHWRVKRSRAVWRTAAVRANRTTSVIIDLGGVLAPTLFESVRIAAFPRGPLSGEPNPYDDVEEGIESERAYWERVERAGGWNIRELWGRCTTLRPSMLTALSAILPRMPVVAFTNDMRHWFGPDWATRFPDIRRLDRVVEAAELGVFKPDPAAFRALMNLIDEPAHRCLFVDDLQANLDGARAVGMQTHLFDVRKPEEASRSLLDRLAIPWPDAPRGC